MLVHFTFCHSFVSVFYGLGYDKFRPKGEKPTLELPMLLVFGLAAGLIVSRPS